MRIQDPPSLLTPHPTDNPASTKTCSPNLSPNTTSVLTQDGAQQEATADRASGSSFGGVPRWCAWSTAVAAALLVVTSLGGFLREATHLDFTTSLHMAKSQGQDLVSLLVALPLLGLALRRAGRGESGGVAVWAGVVAYVAYVQVLYAFGGVYSAFFLAYVATEGLAGFTLARSAALGRTAGVVRIGRY